MLRFRVGEAVMPRPGMPVLSLSFQPFQNRFGRDRHVPHTDPDCVVYRVRNRWRHYSRRRLPYPAGMVA